MDEYETYMHEKHGVDVYTVYYIDHDNKLKDIESITEYDIEGVLEIAIVRAIELNARLFEVYKNGECQNTYKVFHVGGVKNARTDI